MGGIQCVDALLGDLPAVGADTRRNAFEDQSGCAFVQSHGGLTNLSFSLLANNTPHVVFLLLKSDSHSVKSGSPRFDAKLALRLA